MFGLEDNYDPELLNSISFETKRKKEKKLCVDFEKITIKETVLTFDQKKGPTSGLANKAIYINKSETHVQVQGSV